jgi:hypothetical protein
VGRRTVSALNTLFYGLVCLDVVHFAERVFGGLGKRDEDKDRETDRRGVGYAQSCGEQCSEGAHCRMCFFSEWLRLLPFSANDFAQLAENGK